MTTDSDSRELHTTSVDYVVNALRAIVGPLPIVGPLFSELAGVVVPNQRIERIAKFASELERRLRSLEAANAITGRLQSDHFADLLEEGVRQASRSLSDERRQYLAALIVNGLSTQDIEYSESRHLLRALDQMSDVEVVWLRFYREPTIGGDEEFRKRHESILAPAIAALSSSQHEVDKHTLQESYWEHLWQLGMLERRYRVDIESQEPKFDRDGVQEVAGYAITALGSLLLRQIGLGEASLPEHAQRP